MTIWRAEIDRLHATRPGITETVLRDATWRGVNAYRWLTEGVDPKAVVIDLGCGSAPTAEFCGSQWIGVDLSEAELRVAERKHHDHLIVTDMRFLPFSTACADLAVSSMSLMLVERLDLALNEIFRVLKPGGEFRFIVPSSRKLTIRDRLRYLRLLRCVRLNQFFPPFGGANDLLAQLGRSGFKIENDESRRFKFNLHNHQDGDLLIDSLYLPGVDEKHRNRAARIAHSWSGTDLGISLRRTICTPQS